MHSTSQVLLSALIAGVSALASPSFADDFTRIETEAEFRKLVVNRKLTLGENYATFKKNGKVTGEFGGAKLDGAWAWRDGYWCRTLTTHSKNTDCQLMEISGNQLRGTRSRGKGQSFVYQIK